VSQLSNPGGAGGKERKGRGEKEKTKGENILIRWGKDGNTQSSTQEEKEQKLNGPQKNWSLRGRGGGGKIQLGGGKGV